MNRERRESVWERTNVTNLLHNRQSGTYYARVKVNGKQKWRTLETNVFSVAKLRLGDAEKALRARGLAAKGASQKTGANQTAAFHFISIFRSTRTRRRM